MRCTSSTASFVFLKLQTLNYHSTCGFLISDVHVYFFFSIDMPLRVFLKKYILSELEKKKDLLSDVKKSRTNFILENGNSKWIRSLWIRCLFL